MVPAAEQRKEGGRSCGHGTSLTLTKAWLCCCSTLCAAFLAPIQQSSYRCPLPTACVGLYLCSTEMLQPGFSPRRITVREAEAPAGRAALRPQGWFGSPGYNTGGRKGNTDCCEDGALTPCGAVMVLYTPWRGGRTETWEKQWWWGREICRHILGKVLGECQAQKLQRYLNATT